MISVDKIAKLIDGQIIGDKTFQVEDICDVEKGKKNCITYLSNSKYKKYLKDSNASVILVNNDFKEDTIDKIYIKVSNPAVSFIDIINLFHPPFKEESKIYDSVSISKNAKLGKDLFIGPNVIIEENVEIDRTPSSKPAQRKHSNTLEQLAKEVERSWTGLPRASWMKPT